jgi:hypothetical protein
MLTLKEILVKAADGLMKQGKVATGPDGTCRYRTKRRGEVLRCAVGQLIGDDQYSPAYEGIGVISILAPNGVEQSNLHKVPLLKASLLSCGIDANDNDMVKFLDKMQVIHDGEEPKRWREKFIGLANEFGIEGFECPPMADPSSCT